MIINNNISSMRSQGALFQNNRALGNDLHKLSTGLRINKSSDDAAGLAISENLRAQIRGQQQAKRNTLDGISALSIADGAMNEIHNILQRQRELSIQAANATYSSSERTYIKNEINALNAEIIRIISATKFNGIPLLGTGVDSLAGASAALQVDANSDSNVDAITIQYGGLWHVAVDRTVDPDDASGMGAAIMTVTEMASSDIVEAQDAWRAHIGYIDDAIRTVSNARAEIGVIINRLEHTVTNLTTSITNQQAAESQLRDLDFAYQSSVFTKNQILTQSATSMLTQANAITQGALSLIRG